MNAMDAREAKNKSGERSEKERSPHFIFLSIHAILEE